MRVVVMHLIVTFREGGLYTTAGSFLAMRVVQTDRGGAEGHTPKPFLHHYTP
jgi:hypothetical protein